MKQMTTKSTKDKIVFEFPSELEQLNTKGLLKPRIYSFDEVRKLLKAQRDEIIKIILKYKENELRGDYSDVHFAENEINRELIDWIVGDIDKIY